MSSIDTDRPQEFKRFWPTVMTGWLGMGLGIGGLFLSTAGVFIDPLTHAFGWSRVQLSAWPLCMTAGLMLGMPIVGRLADVFGVRSVSLVSIFVFAACVTGFGFVGGSIWALYAVIFACAFLGVGTGGVLYSKAVVSRFRARRGLALGVIATGPSVATIFGPKLLQLIVDDEGWRFGIWFVAWAALIALPLAYFFLPPRDTGLAQGVSLRAYRLAGVARSPFFWILGTSFFLFGMASAGLGFHLIPYLSENGLTRSHAVEYAGLLGLASFVGRVVVGFALDRVSVLKFGALLFLVLCAGLMLFAGFRAQWALSGVLLVGLAYGGEFDFMPYCVAHFFGRKSFGALYAYFYWFASAGVASGPLLVGYVRGATGAYDSAFGLSAGLAFVGGGLILFAQRLTPAPSTASVDA